MNLGDQVTSLELSKRLKELDVKQDSFAYWIKDYDDASGRKWDLFGEGFFYGQNYDAGCFTMGKWTQENYGFASAFTASELGKLMSKLFDPFKLDIKIEYSYYCCNWFATIEYDEDEVENSNELKTLFEDENEANLRAKMLIYLLENKLITL